MKLSDIKEIVIKTDLPACARCGTTTGLHCTTCGDPACARCTAPAWEMGVPETCARCFLGEP